MICPMCGNDVVYGSGQRLMCSICDLDIQDFEDKLKKVRHEIISITRDTAKADRIMGAIKGLLH